MRTLIATIVLFACLSGAVRADDAPVSADDQAAIRTVITNQITAFQHDDAAGAFGYAAPSTQGVFGTPETFMDMVKRGYAPVYRPHSVQFATIEQGDQGIIQNVELIGPDGLPYTARYTMEHEADGSWRIVACEIVQSRRLGA